MQKEISLFSYPAVLQLPPKGISYISCFLTLFIRVLIHMFIISDDIRSSVRNNYNLRYFILHFLFLSWGLSISQGPLPPSDNWQHDHGQSKRTRITSILTLLLQLRTRNFNESIRELSLQFGPVFTIFIPFPMVVIASYEALKEAFVVRGFENSC